MSASSVLKSLFRLPDFSRRPVFKFIQKRIGPFDGTVVLDRNRVYILPTKTGVLFFVLLLLLLLGSVNYSKSLGFMLTFLLVGLGNIAMFATWRNLAGLRLRAGGGMPVFAGEQAAFAVQLENSDTQPRYSIALSREGEEYEVLDVAANAVSQAHFRVPAKHRGLLQAGRFRLYTEYPTGLFVAWTWIELNMHCLVYPRPADRAVLPVSSHTQEGDMSIQGAGLEDFSGLRKYQTGDSWRRISWKAAARFDELHTREFAGGQPQLEWIEWESLVSIASETRLSIMTRLVIDAEASGRQYGLRLPAIEITPAHGSSHYNRCLKALALFEIAA